MKNLEGKKIGRLLPIFPTDARTNHGSIIWHCLCDCGAEVDVASANMGVGKTESCGCLRKERTSIANKTHGLAGTPVYHCWLNMKVRCTDPTHKQYADYGGRGITVCPEWLSFEQFFADMGMPPEGMTLDREDNDSGYSKANCRWGTKKEQSTNRRSVKLIAYKGEVLCIRDWSRRLEIPKSTLHRWLDSGLDLKACIEKAA